MTFKRSALARSGAAIGCAMAATIVAALLSTTPARAQEIRGVSAKEIRIGTLLDLSGPLASAGKDARNGMQMRVDEINAEGGISGRQVRLLVEDHAYDPKRAVLATQKLIDQDGIFMIVGQLGTATMLATVPVLQQKKVINFLPLTGTAHAYEPARPLMYAYLPSYEDQLKKTLPTLVRQKQPKKVCAIYQDDDFGAEVIRGTEAGLKETGLPLVERMSYKRGTTDFSSQVLKASAAKCDFVVLATVTRETVGVMTEARKIGFTPTFFATVSAYSANVAQLGGDNVEGLYSTVVVDQPYSDSGSPELRAWAQRYKTSYREEASVFSAQGYFVMASFASAARRAGTALTTDSFVTGLESAALPSTIFGTPPMTFTASTHLGIEEVRIAQIQGGRWVAHSR